MISWNESGEITRQEAVSMIPVLMLNPQPSIFMFKGLQWTRGHRIGHVCSSRLQNTPIIAFHS